MFHKPGISSIGLAMAEKIVESLRKDTHADRRFREQGDLVHLMTRRMEVSIVQGYPESRAQSQKWREADAYARLLRETFGLVLPSTKTMSEHPIDELALHWRFLETSIRRGKTSVKHNMQYLLQEKPLLLTSRLAYPSFRRGTSRTNYCCCVCKPSRER